MAIEVDYVPFATGGSADVMSQADYLTDAPDGVVPGIGDPTFANKAWRQSSMIAAAVAWAVSSAMAEARAPPAASSSSGERVDNRRTKTMPRYRFHGPAMPIDGARPTRDGRDASAALAEPGAEWGGPGYPVTEMVRRGGGQVRGEGGESLGAMKNYGREANSLLGTRLNLSPGTGRQVESIASVLPPNDEYAINPGPLPAAPADRGDNAFHPAEIWRRMFGHG